VCIYIYIYIYIYSVCLLCFWIAFLDFGRLPGLVVSSLWITP